jgi:hypothetical protein
MHGVRRSSDFFWCCRASPRIISKCAPTPSNPRQSCIGLEPEELILRKAIPRKPPPIPEETLKRREAAAAGTAPARLGMLAKESVALARLVARNSSSPAALLEKLGSHRDPGVRKWVTRNANTPAVVAARLGAQFPTQLLENPAFDLYLLEYPDLLERIGIGALRSVLRRPNCPRGLFAYASRFEDAITQLSILQNASVPRSIVERLEQSPHAAVRNAAAAHISMSKEMSLETVLKHFETSLIAAGNEATPTPMHNALAYLLTLRRLDSRCCQILSSREQALVNTATPDVDVRCALTTNPSVPIADLEQLTTDLIQNATRISTETLVAVAKSQETIPVVLEKMAFGPKRTDSYGRSLAGTVAVNPSTPSGVLEVLSTDPERGVRRCVASNPSTPSSVLEVLSTDLEPSVRRCVASNPSAPGHVLALLARDTDENVRFDIAQNQLTPACVLTLLAVDPATRVRCCVARNYSTPVSMVESLAADPDPDVRRAIAQNSLTPTAVLETLSADPDSTIRSRIAEHRSASSSVLEKLAADPDTYVRRQVVDNTSAPISVLEKLSTDSDPDVRRQVAWNSSTPKGVLQGLSADSDLGVRSAVARRLLRYMSSRADIRQAELAISAEDFDKTAAGEAQPTVLEALANHNARSVRMAVALNTSTPAAVLEVLATDWASGVRGNVARNSSTPEALLEALAQDEDFTVRGAVAQSPHAPLSMRLEVLAALAADPSEFVRGYAAEIRQQIVENATSDDPTTTLILERFAVDLDAGVRSAVAENPSTPDVLLEVLSHDLNSGVRYFVAENPSTPGAVLANMTMDQDQGVVEAVMKRFAQFPKDQPLSVAVLESFSNAPASNVRRWVAGHSSTPDIVLKRLALDCDQTVRQAVARNPATPINILQYLALSVEISDAFRGRCATALFSSDPASALSNLRQEVVKSLTRPAIGSYSRLLGFLLPDCPVASLAQAQRSSSWLERCAIALHPATPISTLQQLAGDGITMVRSAAIERLKQNSSHADASASNREQSTGIK